MYEPRPAASKIISLSRSNGYQSLHTSLSGPSRGAGQMQILAKIWIRWQKWGWRHWACWRAR
ncbi:hypothetical protein ACNKHL_22160 [Shigella flexneri]